MAAAAGVSIQCENGGSRLLASLIYADDLALVANFPSHLQGLIDALSDFCASAGLEISATKTQVMQFLPLVRINILKVKAHAGIAGNEYADAVAKDETLAC